MNDSGELSTYEINFRSNKEIRTELKIKSPLTDFSAFNYYETYYHCFA